MNLQRPKLILPELASAVLKDASESFKENKEFTNETLQSLHAVYNDVSLKAFNLLDRYKFVEYKTANGFRSVFKILGKKHHYTLFDSINFCSCRCFEEEVLATRNDLTCEHVLALELARIVGMVQVELVNNGQLTELLKNQTSLIFNG